MLLFSVSLHDLSVPYNRTVVSCTSHPPLIDTIKGFGEVTGMVTMDNILYVVHSGALYMYVGSNGFNLSVIPSPDRRVKRFIRRLLNAVHLAKSRVRSGLHDIACFQPLGLLYVTDRHKGCVHCVQPHTCTSKLVCRWNIATGDPSRIFVTSDGNVLIVCPDSGQLFVYSGDGHLLSTVSIKIVHNCPWQRLRDDPNLLIFCDDRAGYVFFADRNRNFFGGYSKVRDSGHSHLAVLPDGRILVALKDENRIVLLAPFEGGGQTQEILNSCDGIKMPVRLHYCKFSGELIVGQADGSILIYGANDVLNDSPIIITNC